MTSTFKRLFDTGAATPYSEIYPEMSEDLAGMQHFFKQFSFPGGIGSHATPETPGSIHEGGELGYSLSHAYGTVFDNPDLITLVMVGDGESETGPLATSWHSNKFLNPMTDGAVLPVLHLNGYKINNPTILARISHEELEALFVGYGYTPYFVEGNDPLEMHQAMAATLEHCVLEIQEIQKEARRTGKPFRPRWPMIVLRSPKGWTAPRKVDGHYLEGFRRAHQVPITDIATNPEHLKLLEQWMRSYRLEELFDETGRLVPELKELAPKGPRRMSANPVANGGLLRKPLDMPDFRSFAVDVKRPGATWAGNVPTLGGFLREIMRRNMQRFRVFGPDETQSNRLEAIYDVGKKVWLEEYFPEDADGGELAQSGRVMEMLSEHTVEGWLEGYLLSGRHGLINSYEPFIHVIDSMFNQHAKWLEKCAALPWRARLASLNLLITALVWRQDLFRLVPHSEHPHGMPDSEFEALFAPDKPTVFNFHAYPWLIHRLTYRRPAQHQIHVRGYKEQGNINTPLELAIRNQTDRFSLAIDAIDRVPRLRNRSAHVREALLNQQIACKNYAMEFGLDPPEIAKWEWPF
jgi:xylulose-5-phosphate/fructose-6-phosphate phosphoketolase